MVAAKSRLRLWIALSLAMTAASLMAATNYVAGVSGSDANNGSSWAQAFKTISNAVARAGDGSVTNVVMVSNGVYTLSAEIYINNGITVMGASTNPADTIIDGNHAFRCFGLANDNAVISGLKIVNGNSDQGGGVKIRYGGLMTNCVVCSNNAPTTIGGGVYLYSRGWVRNCVIANNTAATDGGGLYMQCAEGYTGMVQDCTLSGNTNTAGSGGGAYLYGSTLYPDTCVISNCTIFNNRAAGWGGGLCFQNDGLARNCLIQCNSNSGTYGGGAAFLSGGKILDSRLLDNQCNYGGGAALNNGGTLRNCLLQGNHCDNHGGAIYGNTMNTYSGNVSSCTIVSNRALLGGAIYFESGTSVGTNCVVNCIFYQDVATQNAAYNEFFMDLSSLHTNAFCFCSAPYSSVYGPLPPDRGNITNNPVFVNTNAGNYRLLCNSPCINTGTNQTWMVDAQDLDGRRRIDQLSGYVDMGAYEFIFPGVFIKVY